MKVDKLLQNRRLLTYGIEDTDPRALKVKISVRRYFIRMRFKTFLDDSSLRDDKKDELLDTKEEYIVGVLCEEMRKIEEAVKKIVEKINNEDLLPVSGPTDPFDNRFKQHLHIKYIGSTLSLLYYEPLFKIGGLVYCIVWRAAARDISLVQDNIKKFVTLHRIVDRRLRTVELMLYRVGSNQIFTYPKGDRTQVNVDARLYWDEWSNVMERPHELRAGADVEKAIEALFMDQSSEAAMNQFYCDHVIHALHLESLLFVRKKHAEGTSGTINLEALHALAAHGDVKIASSWFDALTKGEISGIDIPQFFQLDTVVEPDLQIGDQIKIWNHPLFIRLLPEDFAIMENVIVISTDPDPKYYMGLGFKPKSLWEQKKELYEHLTTPLKEYRRQAQTIPPEKIAQKTEREDLWFKRFRSGDVPDPPDWKFDQSTCSYAEWWLEWRVENKYQLIGSIMVPRPKYAVLEMQTIKQVATNPEICDFVWKYQNVKYKADEHQDMNSAQWEGYGYFPLWVPRPFDNPDTNALGEIISVQPTEACFGTIKGTEETMKETLKYLFYIDISFSIELDKGEQLSDALLEEFRRNGLTLPQQTVPTKIQKGVEWMIHNGDREYIIKIDYKPVDVLSVYERRFFTLFGWNSFIVIRPLEPDEK